MRKISKTFLLASKILFSSAFLIGYLIEKKKPEREYLKYPGHDILNLSAGITDKAVMALITTATYSVFDIAERKNFGLLNSPRLHCKVKMVFALILIDLWMYLWHRMN